MSKNDRRQYRSVTEMLRETAAPDEAMTAEELERYSADRKLVKELAILRSARGMTQQQLADVMGCTQSWVSKIENSCDDELSIGDLRKYLDGLGLEFRPGAVKKGATLVDEVKQLTFAIRKKLFKLAELAKEGDGIVENVAQFFGSLFHNFNNFLSEAARKLPPGAGSRPCISIEFLEEVDMLEEEELEHERSIRNRLPSRKVDCALHN